MSALQARLRDREPLVLDGGLGSMLIARGLAAGTAPEAWILDRPAEIVAVHRAYVDAGSDAVHTATFGANRLRLAHVGLEARVAEINRAAVTLARDSGARFVLGDVGPSGQYLPPVGNADPVAWADAFREQSEALVSAGVDGLHVETMSDLREAHVALAVLREVDAALPIFVSLTFERRKRGFFTVMGDPVVASLGALAAAGANVVGANCTLTSGDLRVLAEEVRELGHPIVLQPNAGAPELVDGALRYGQEPAEYARDTDAMFASGALAVGGCCGTDPRFIAALVRQRTERRGA